MHTASPLGWRHSLDAVPASFVGKAGNVGTVDSGAPLAKGNAVLSALGVEELGIGTREIMGKQLGVVASLCRTDFKRHGHVGSNNMRAAILLAPFALTACSHTQPGVEIRVVERLVEVQKPCAATVPERPLPFVRPTGEGLEALAAALAAKLAEYSAEGKYADRAESYFEACPPGE